MNSRASMGLAGAAAAVLAAAFLPAGCRRLEPVEVEADMKRDWSTFDGIAKAAGVFADAIVLEGEGGSRVLVSPKLNGRVLTLKVGKVESVGFVNAASIQQRDTDPHFNNYGGLDRFWLYPEAGQYGLYFPRGAEFNRNVWTVPRDLNEGEFQVVERSPAKILLLRPMEVVNYSGTPFRLDVSREIGILWPSDLPSELGVTLPGGVKYAGVYSKNSIANRSAEAWDAGKGLIGVWILGMFNPSESAAVIAPFRPAPAGDPGRPFNDEYFGKISAEAPERLKVLGNAVCLKADARRVGKLGISQARTTGLGGAIDFGRNLLIVVKFDVPALPERYGNSTWVKDQPEPYRGDAFQTYNSGVPGDTTGKLADAPFFELESASPVRPLGPGDTLTHRHATHCFQGDPRALATLARQLLGVDIDQMRTAMLGK